MTEIPRRTLLAYGGSAAALAALSACAPPVATGTPSAAPPPQAAPVLDRVPVPPGTIDSLPGDGSLLAWTVDDGTSTDVITAYAAFAQASGIRLTMFVTGTYIAWDESVDALVPLVASGQVQPANHTWSHPDLTSLPDAEVRDELVRTHDFIGELFGVDARPFFRPPYGYHDDRVDAIAADLGYTVPTLWYGSLADSAELPAATIVDLAREWFLPQHIVIGHLNWMPVTTVFEDLRAIIDERGLTTVTLNDVFTSEYHP
ncbi:polysaccharide deacetylase family protein [Agromyces bauzanensis]